MQRELSNFVALIGENDALIRRICRMYMENEEDRKDLYQEIVLRLWKSMPTFRGDSSIGTWIYRVALNTAISYFRREKRKPTAVEISAEQQAPGGRFSPDVSEETRLLYRAIDKLTRIERALVLLYLDDKPYEEISGIMGITPNNLRVKMFRIREKLKAIMSGDAPVRQKTQLGTQRPAY